MSSATGTIRPLLGKLTGIKGRVITADDPTYDQARTVFYGGIDKRPSAIVRVSDVEDVRRVIRVARAEGGDSSSPFEAAVIASSATARRMTDL